jgi:hypothetical protein
MAAKFHSKMAFRKSKLHSALGDVMLVICEV